MDTALYVSKLVELTRYQTDIIEELLLELMQYRDIEKFEDALASINELKEDIGE